MGKMIDMTGWRMSEHGQPNSILTVIERDTEFDKIRTTESIRWICKCDCGNIKSISGAELRRKNKPTLSCGCLFKERIKNFGKITFRDLTGQQFGDLTVINKIGSNKYNYAIWHCKCKCGNECDVVSRELLSGDTRSCGCRKTSHNEDLIEQFLIQKNIKYQREYSFKDLYDIDLLRFDYAIFDDNNCLLCLIEYQGEQHTIKTNRWYNEKLVLHDKMKKDYCKLNNINLIEIQFYDNITNKLNELYERGCFKSVWTMV